MEAAGPVASEIQVFNSLCPVREWVDVESRREPRGASLHMKEAVVVEVVGLSLTYFRTIQQACIIRAVERGFAGQNN